MVTAMRTAILAAAIALFAIPALAQSNAQSLPDAILTNAFVGALKAATIAQGQIEALQKQVADLKKQNDELRKMPPPRPAQKAK